MIEFLNGQYYIVDMGSTNGVEYNGSAHPAQSDQRGRLVQKSRHELCTRLLIAPAPTPQGVYRCLGLEGVRAHDFRPMCANRLLSFALFSVAAAANSAPVSAPSAPGDFRCLSHSSVAIVAARTRSTPRNGRSPAGSRSRRPLPLYAATRGPVARDAGADRRSPVCGELVRLSTATARAGRAQCSRTVCPTGTTFGPDGSSATRASRRRDLKKGMPTRARSQASRPFRQVAHKNPAIRSG